MRTDGRRLPRRLRGLPDGRGGRGDRRRRRRVGRPAQHVALRAEPVQVLALRPRYLVLAHEQAGPALREDTFAGQLADSVRNAAAPPADPAVRAALAGFLAPLSRMTLLAAGLRCALAGDLDVPPTPGRPPSTRPVRPERPAPSPQDAPAPGVQGRIRAALRTPIINSIWRALGPRRPADGGLGCARSAGRRQPAGRRRAAAARLGTGQVPWQVGAIPAALEAAGVADAAPGDGAGARRLPHHAPPGARPGRRLRGRGPLTRLGPAARLL